MLNCLFKITQYPQLSFPGAPMSHSISYSSPFSPLMYSGFQLHEADVSLGMPVLCSAHLPIACVTEEGLVYKL